MMKKVAQRPDGIVLNKMPRRSGIDYYYYYGEHGYHDGVYGSGPAPGARRREKIA